MLAIQDGSFFQAGRSRLVEAIADQPSSRWWARSGETAIIVRPLLPWDQVEMTNTEPLPDLEVTEFQVVMQGRRRQLISPAEN